MAQHGLLSRTRAWQANMMQRSSLVPLLNLIPTRTYRRLAKEQVGSRQPRRAHRASARR
jgi:hypothetical protein